MFCIAAFLVFGILAIFSAAFRPLAAKAWHCTWRRITLRPCDVSFGEEMKGRLLAHVVFRAPRLARVLDRWIDWISLAFVVLSLWSLVYVLNAGLNLWVYDTCTPQNAESCSLSGEACGVEQDHVTLTTALAEGRLAEWATGPFTRFAETVSRIPDRVRTWEPREYRGPTASFLLPVDDAKPDALEIIDPSCTYCRKLTGNILRAEVASAYNVSYLLYPIPADGGTKFPHSELLARYLEAAKRVPLNDGGPTPGDWQLLEAIFDQEDDMVQQRFVLQYGPEEAQAAVEAMLRTIGYEEAEVRAIAALSRSAEVTHSLAEQKEIVETRIRTIKIPTLLIGGRRFDRVIDQERLEDFVRKAKET